MITDRIVDLSIVGPLEDVIKLLSEYKDQGWERLDYYDNGCSTHNTITKTRLETDDEFEVRKNRIEKKRQKEGSNDYKEYLRLKNIFEKEVN